MTTPAAASQPHKPTSPGERAREGRSRRDRAIQERLVGRGPGEGYELMFGCVSGGDFGAMGLHYVNVSLVDGEVDVDAARDRPVRADAERRHPDHRRGLSGARRGLGCEASGEGPPQLMGQLFHLFESPNRFGLDAFYTLHVWAWKDNPNGTFVNWNPDVSCDAFNEDQSVTH